MIVIYTQNLCPKCKVLKKKLDNKNIKYVECDDVNTLISKNIDLTPVLEIDGNMMNYSDAINWVNEV